MGTHKKCLVNVLLMSSNPQDMFLWRNEKNITTFVLKKASYEELCPDLFPLMGLFKYLG